MGMAFDKFKESLELAISLKKLERDKFESSRQGNQPYIKGLRGGSTVLMVAAFEFYLKRLFEENISKLNTSPPSIDLMKLPDKFKEKIFFDTLELAMKGPKHGQPLKRVDRINDIVTTCRHLIGEHINPITFTDTSSNPNAETVKRKFKEIGTNDIFVIIKSDFERKWGGAVAATFIEDKLDEIVNTRHVVAHTADTLRITKAFQNEAIKFLKILAELLEKEMVGHIKTLSVSAKK